MNSVALGNPFFKSEDFNVVSFILSVTSMIFDTIFFFQFWLYKNNKPSQKLPDLDDLGEEGRGILDESPKAIAASKTVSAATGNDSRNSFD